MNDVFWEIVKPYIKAKSRPLVLHKLTQVGMSERLILPGFGYTERGTRIITHEKGESYRLTASQLTILSNIVSRYPKVCSPKQALEGLRAKYNPDKDDSYLRVIVSKMKDLCPELKSHICAEVGLGYRWE